MKKHIKLVVFLISLLIVFVIFKVFQKENNKVYYIALGDSISEGMTPYRNIDYGYPDYIRDYYNQNKKLKFYTKKYSKSGYKIKDIKYDIESNKTIEVDNKKVHLKEALRNSDLVTLTIGINDFFDRINSNNIEIIISDIPKSKKTIDSIKNDLKDLIILIQKFVKNNIIVTGYYNPYPRLTEYKEEIDELVKYYNYEIEEMCDELVINYVNIFDIFEENKELLPNPSDIHPNKLGYELIAKKIMSSLKS